MSTLLDDLKFALRTFLKSPGLVLIAILSLAIGIGANASIFSFVNAFALRPLPVERPDELVAIYSSDASGTDYGTACYPDYKDFRDTSQSFAGLVAHSGIPLSLRTDSETIRIAGEIVTGNYFDVLGIQALLGRTFLPEEDRTPGAHPVAVISHALWKERFNSDPQLPGKTIVLNGHPFTVIGVAPEGFDGIEFGPRPALWVPMMTAAQTRPRPFDLLAHRGARWLRITGRLKPGVSPVQARAEMSSLAANLAKAYPKSNEGYVAVALFPASHAQIWPELRSGVLSYLNIVMALMGIVLLVACANVANLLLARASTRRKEIAVRISLGASRGRLIRQLLTESVLLASVAGIAGLLLSLWGTDLLTTLSTNQLAGAQITPATDWRVIFFTLALSALTGILFGVAPAFQATRSDLVPALKGEFSSQGRGGSRLRNALVVGQLALSLVLLISAGLFLRSLNRYRSLDLGFDPEHLLISSVDLRLHGYDPVRGLRFWQDLQQRVESIPGVRAAGLSETVPLIGGAPRQTTYPEGYTFKPDESSEIDVYEISPRYFASMGIPILRGRDFSERDTQNSQQVSIVNQAFADKYWPNQDPIGKKITLFEPGRPLPPGVTSQPMEVVAVSKTGKYRALAEPPRPVYFLPISQSYSGTLTLHVRTAGNPLEIAPAIRREVRALDANLPVFRIRAMSDALGTAYSRPRTTATLFALFGGVALLLAAVGFYGVMAYSVGQRTREIGVRIALGAQRSAVLGLVLRQGLTLTLIGMALGIAAAFGATRYIASMLFGVSRTDLATFAIVPLVLFSVALLACWLPARRATRVDPLTALRYE